jgi:hypothetical protein
MFYIDFIADYGLISGQDDLAFSEVDRRLCEEFSKLNLDFPMIKNLSVHPFNTVETGFVVAQLSQNSRLGKNHIIYHNTAPRKDELSARENNAGEFLAVCELENGVRVIGVYGGYSFSLLNRPVYRVKCAAEGSQFRSRDVFPPCVASLAQHAGKPLTDWELLGELVENVPSVPENRILGIDGYGNLKTNIQFNNDIQSVEINGVEKSICTGSGIFDIQDGSLVLAPGSSGWQGNYFVEICLRGGSASKLFNNPKPGDTITLK